MQTCHLGLLHVAKQELQNLNRKTSINIQKGKLNHTSTADRKVNIPVK